MIDQQPLEQHCNPKISYHDADSDKSGVIYHSGHRHLLKCNELFAILGRGLDIHYIPDGEHGLFYRDCRYLAKWELRIFNKAPIVLQAMQNPKRRELITRLVNDEVSVDEHLLDPGAVHLTRSICLTGMNFLEKVRITNFTRNELDIPIEFRFFCDFKDSFELRKIERKKHGKLLSPEYFDKGISVSYVGLDDIKRTMTLKWNQEPDAIDENSCSFVLKLKPGEIKAIETSIGVAEDSDSRPKILSYSEGKNLMAENKKKLQEKICQISTDNVLVNKWINYSADDLHMLITECRKGPYPFAGLPWFASIFGRDGIITALQSIWHYPELAKGVLLNLAHLQGDEVDHTRDMEPGKIIHEFRMGEMSNLNEIPFGRYYGAVDSTPLYIVLAAEYFKISGDEDFIRDIWDNLLQCYYWLEQYGDRDQDLFIEYRRSEAGLLDQGWKDSPNAIVHKNGAFAPGPIALCEVQGYKYAALMGLAFLARVIDEREFAEILQRKAKEFATLFDQKFWWNEMSTYYMALDGNKEPCELLASNPGHCLWSKIVPADKGLAVKESLKMLYSGWGIRTLSDTENIFNPISYHHGSVWPHDTAIIAQGLSQYGFKNEVIELFNATFDAAKGFDHHRLPELFCGFARLDEEYPTHFPSACAPQAWAASCVFSFFTSLLGMEFNAKEQMLIFRKPMLPDYINKVNFRNFKLGNSLMDFMLYRNGDKIAFCQERIEGEVRIVIDN